MSPMVIRHRATKPWYKSKTIWLNVCSVIGAVVMALVPVVGPVASAAIMAGVGAANIALRATDTGQP